MRLDHLIFRSLKFLVLFYNVPESSKKILKNCRKNWFLGMYVKLARLCFAKLWNNVEQLSQFLVRLLSLVYTNDINTIFRFVCYADDFSVSRSRFLLQKEMLMLLYPPVLYCGCLHFNIGLCIQINLLSELTATIFCQE